MAAILDAILNLSKIKMLEGRPKSTRRILRMDSGLLKTIKKTYTYISRLNPISAGLVNECGRDAPKNLCIFIDSTFES